MNKLETSFLSFAVTTLVFTGTSKYVEVVDSEDDLGNDKTEWLAGILSRCSLEYLDTEDIIIWNLGVFVAINVSVTAY